MNLSGPRGPWQIWLKAIHPYLPNFIMQNKGMLFTPEYPMIKKIVLDISNVIFSDGKKIRCFVSTKIYKFPIQWNIWSRKLFSLSNEGEGLFKYELFYSIFFWTWETIVLILVNDFNNSSNLMQNFTALLLMFVDIQKYLSCKCTFKGLTINDVITLGGGGWVGTTNNNILTHNMWQGGRGSFHEVRERA